MVRFCANTDHLTKSVSKEGRRLVIVPDINMIIIVILSTPILRQLLIEFISLHRFNKIIVIHILIGK